MAGESLIGATDNGPVARETKRQSEAHYAFSEHVVHQPAKEQRGNRICARVPGETITRLGRTER